MMLTQQSESGDYLPKMEQLQIPTMTLTGLRREWLAPRFVVVFLVIANAALIFTIIALSIYFADDRGYRSESEFLLETQRAYDVATYSLFSTVIFFIIASMIKLAMQLKITMESVDYATEQVNRQRKEYEEAVRRYVRDAYIVKKYQESDGQTAFEPVEEKVAVRTKRERTVMKTMDEISKRLTALKKMESVMDLSDKKNFDTKFVKLMQGLKSEQVATDSKIHTSQQIRRMAQTQEITEEAGPTEEYRTRNAANRTQRNVSQFPISQTQADITQRSIGTVPISYRSEKTQFSRTAPVSYAAQKTQHSKLVVPVERTAQSMNHAIGTRSVQAVRRTLHDPGVARTQSVSSESRTQGSRSLPLKISAAAIRTDERMSRLLQPSTRTKLLTSKKSVKSFLKPGTTRFGSVMTSSKAAVASNGRRMRSPKEGLASFPQRMTAPKQAVAGSDRRLSTPKQITAGPKYGPMKQVMPNAVTKTKGGTGSSSTGMSSFKRKPRSSGRATITSKKGPSSPKYKTSTAKTSTATTKMPQRPVSSQAPPSEKSAGDSSESSESSDQDS